MKKTFRLNSPAEVDEAIRCWGTDVISYDRVACTVRVDINDQDLKNYEYYHEIDNMNG